MSDREAYFDRGATCCPYHLFECEFNAVDFHTRSFSGIQSLLLQVMEETGFDITPLAHEEEYISIDDLVRKMYWHLTRREEARARESERERERERERRI